MKVIFLDFDGVLNSSCYAARLIKAGKPTQDENGHELFDPAAIKRFNRIVDQTEAKVVISSSWRYLGLTTMKEIWQERGLHGQIIGMTSLYAVDELIIEHGLEWLTNGAEVGSPRAVEIEVWLQEHNNLDQYVILDDLPMSAALLPHFVQINPIYGLSDPQATKAIEILNRKEYETIK